jgi:hypothetical protein
MDESSLVATVVLLPLAAVVPFSLRSFGVGTNANEQKDTVFGNPVFTHLPNAHMHHDEQNDDDEEEKELGRFLCRPFGLSREA